MDNIEINQFFDGLMTPTFISDETFEELTAPRRNEEDNETHKAKDEHTETHQA